MPLGGPRIWTCKQPTHIMFESHQDKDVQEYVCWCEKNNWNVFFHRFGLSMQNDDRSSVTELGYRIDEMLTLVGRCEGHAAPIEDLFYICICSFWGVVFVSCRSFRVCVEVCSVCK